MNEYWSKAKQLDKAVEEWQMSGAPTRELATLCNTLTDTLNKLKGISNGKEDIRKAK